MSMCERRVTLDILPRELQTKILELVPLNLWPHLKQILPLGLDSHSVWKNINFDKIDEVDDDLVDLVLLHKDSIKKLVWNFTTWRSSINCNLVLQRFDNLEYLDVAFNENLSDIFFLYHLRKLKHLDLCGCCAVQSYQFEIILPALSDLVSLDVGDCDISKDCILQLVENRKFNLLNVKDCFSIYIEEILEISKNVEVFEFCPLLTRDSLEDWIRVMEQNAHLRMCSASWEILEEIKED